MVVAGDLRRKICGTALRRSGVLDRGVSQAIWALGTREGDPSVCAARVVARPLHSLTQFHTLTLE